MKVKPKIKGFLVFLFLQTISFTVLAQDISHRWSKLNGSGWGIYNFPHKSCSDTNGNIYVTGHLEGSYDFDPGIKETILSSSYYNGHDLFIAKYSPKNKLIWAKALKISNDNGDADIYHMELDNSNNLIISGSFSETVDLDPSNDTFLIRSKNEGFKNGFISKYSNRGDFIWGMALAGKSTIIQCFTVDSSNSLYISGQFSDSIDFDPDAGKAIKYNHPGYGVFLAKYDSSGAYQWNLDLDVYDGQHRGTQVVLDGNNDLILSGSFRNTLDFDPSKAEAKLTNYGVTADVFIAKYKSDGTYIWAKQLKVENDMYLKKILVNNNDDFYIVGLFNGEVDFKTDKYEYKLKPNGNDIFIAKYNKQCDLIWAKQVSSNQSFFGDAFLSQNENLLISGSFIGELNFEPTNNKHKLLDKKGSNYIASFNKKGSLNWARLIESDTTYIANHHIIDSNNLFLYSSFNGQITLDKSLNFTKFTSGKERVLSSCFAKVDVSTTRFTSAFNIVAMNQSFNSFTNMVQDNNGDLICMGYTDSRIALSQFNLLFPKSVEKRDQNIFAKFDGLGRNKWAFTLEYNRSWGRSELACDNENNIYVYDTFIDSFDCDPSDSVYMLRANKGWGVFIAKYNENGHLLWAKSIDNENGLFVGGITIDDNNKVWITGAFNESIDLLPGPGVIPYKTDHVGIFISKFDKNGKLIFAKHHEGNGFNYGIDITSHHNSIYLTGKFTDKCDFDLSTDSFFLYTKGNNHTFISKYDTLGEFKWAKSLFKPKKYDYVNSIKVDENENVYIIGRFYDSTDFDPSNKEYYLYSSKQSRDNAFVASYTSKGNFRWAHDFGNIQETRENILSLDINGSVLTMGGYFTDSIDFDPSLKDTSILYGKYFFSPFILRLDTLGKFINAYAPDMQYGIINGIVSTKHSVYIAGSNFGVANFSLNKNKNHIKFTKGNYNMFIAKYIANCKPSSSRISLSSCTSTLSPSGFYNFMESGTYLDTITNYWDCDSVITIDYINLSSKSIISLSICDSMLSPSAKYIYSQTGIYSDTLTNAAGCDSIITINLTKLEPIESNISVTACDEYISPSGKYTYSSSGIYQDTLSSYKGCDSVISIDLTIINNQPKISFNNNALQVDIADAKYQWLDCDNDYAIIDTAISQKLMPTKSGEYTVVVYEGSCADTADCYDVVILDLMEADIHKISIYPNPAEDLLFISSEEPVQSLKVYHLEGKLLMKNYKETQISIKDLAPSIYYIEVKTEKGIVRFKFVKS